MTEEDMNAKEMTEEVLKEYPEARDSDAVLFYHILKDYLGWPLREEHKEDLEDFYSLESFRRARQHIQSDENRLNPVEEVRRKRYKRAEKIRRDRSELWDDRRELDG